MLLPITPVADPAAHAVGDVAPAAHAEPAGHESHADRPDCDWNRPASHREHTALPLTAELPGAHAAGTAAPVAHAEPSGHSAHSDAAARLVALPYRPLAHSSAADAPTLQYAPSRHESHAVALA